MYQKDIFGTVNLYGLSLSAIANVVNGLIEACIYGC